MRTPPRFVAALAAAALCCLVHGRSSGRAGGTSDPPAVLVQDAMDSAGAWKTFASDGVEIHASVQADPGTGEQALRLDLHFVLGSGYAGIRRDVGVDLPDNYEVAYELRGELPDNNLETKLVDPSGLNVWWINRRQFEFPAQWTRVVARRRHFEFAWGPSGGAALTRAGSVEIVVSSVNGGRGTLWLRNFSVRSLPTASTAPMTLTAGGSSESAAAPASAAIDGDIGSAWRCTPADPDPTLTLDMGEQRELGGLEVLWDQAAAPQACAILQSEDGRQWRPVREISGIGAARQFVRLPDTETRFVRLACRPAGAGGTVGISDVKIVPVEHGQTANAFWSHAAAASARGVFPRGFVGQQSYWTVVGSPSGMDEALVSEDGVIEVGRKGFSIEPFLLVGGRLLTWNDGPAGHSLGSGYLPIPTVTRTWPGFTLETTAIGEGGRVLARYRLTNTGEAPARATLCLALRPFQVNPPTQWLNLPGGSATIRSIAWDAQGAVINADRRVFLPEGEHRTLSSTADRGECAALLAQGFEPPAGGVEDPTGAGSGAAIYEVTIDPGQAREWWAEAPLAADANPSDRVVRDAISGELAFQDAARRWERAIGDTGVQLPRAQRRIADTALSTLAYILINKDGPGIQPGSRNYERSWIRDGSMTSAALLAYGLTDDARKFADWYGEHLFPSGAVPCVVDRRGPDPVPENDSHGQYIWLVWNVYRHTGDSEFLQRHFPRVRAAAQYIQKLREQRLTAEWTGASGVRQEPGKPAVPARAFAGLVPESISHEGYSAKPMHSYWDDLFALRGLQDATRCAGAAGEPGLARQFGVWAADMSESLAASVRAATAAHQIAYMPGCVELGDFDATSTTVGLWPCGETPSVLGPYIRETFQRQWGNFVSRRDSGERWKDYTPYELRQVGSYVMLGDAERAAQVLEFHMQYRRPAEWNQWAEVVRPDPRAAGFVGDMPHTWCGSDFLNSLRIMFAYEREEDQSIVLMGGIPESWTRTGEPIGMTNLHLPGGLLSEVMRREGDRLIVELSGTLKAPPGGLVVRIPAGPAVGDVTVNETAVEVAGGTEIRVDRLPARVVASYGAAR